MAILAPIDARIPLFMAYIYAYIWCSMIAPIDGSEPPEPPLTPATFDSRIQSIRAKSTRGWRPGYATPDIWRRFARCSYAVRQRQDLGHDWGPWPWMECAMAMNGMRHGHEWNAPWPWMEWGHGHEWNRAMAISGAMHGGHIGGAF